MIVTLTAIALQAAAPAAPCPAVAPPLPAALSAWSQAAAGTGALTIGRAADLTAISAATAKLAVQPSRPASGGYLATIGFTVRTAGVYNVAAGGVGQPIRPLWLDVADAANVPLKSLAHGHGPACSGITKILEFRLMPGRYTLLVSGLAGGVPIRVLVASKP